MEKGTILKTGLLSISIIIAGFFIGNTLTKAKKFDRSVEVKGLSEREVMADLAVWPIEIKLAGNDFVELNKKLQLQKNEVKDFFNKMGFSDEEISLGITSIVDVKANEYGGNNYVEFRYIAKSDLTLRTNDIAKIKKSLTKSLDLIAKGILINSKDSWNPIQYSYNKLNDIKPLMIEESTVKAKEVAEKFAKDSNSKVGKIKSAQQGFFSISDRDSNTPEVKVVRVVATINYYLED